MKIQSLKAFKESDDVMNYRNKEIISTMKKIVRSSRNKKSVHLKLAEESEIKQPAWGKPVCIHVYTFICIHYLCIYLYTHIFLSYPLRRFMGQGTPQEQNHTKCPNLVSFKYSLHCKNRLPQKIDSKTKVKKVENEPITFCRKGKQENTQRMMQTCQKNTENQLGWAATILLIFTRM